MTQATLAARSEEGGYLRLVLGGEIDMANADHLGDQMHAAIGNQVMGVVVDLTDVTYFDSAGVRVLAMLASRLHQLRVDLQLVVPEGSLARRVVEIAGLGALATESSGSG